MKERKALYPALHPETGHGKAPGAGRGKRPKMENVASFSDDAAKKVGKSSRTVRNQARIGEAIPQDVRDRDMIRE
jgi:hypothetical protein